MASRKKPQLPKRLFKKPRGLAVPPGVKVIHNPPGMEKMSAILEDFIEPFRTPGQPTDELRRLMMVAVIGWNIALLPEDERQAKLEAMPKQDVAGLGVEGMQSIWEMVEIFIEHKLREFADVRRKVVSFELVDWGDEYNLKVLSTLSE